MLMQLRHVFIFVQLWHVFIIVQLNPYSHVRATPAQVKCISPTEAQIHMFGTTPTHIRLCEAPARTHICQLWRISIWQYNSDTNTYIGATLAPAIPAYIHICVIPACVHNCATTAHIHM